MHNAAADAETDSAPTQDDIARIINIIKDRDAELRALREELVRISDENRKLREDVLPIIKDRKNRSEPLPTPDEVPDSAALSSAPKTGGGMSMSSSMSSSLSRKFSTKRLFLSNNKPNNLSPTSIHDSRLQDSSSLDPSAAAVAATNHLTASMRDDPSRSPNPANQPSPTSPAYSSLGVTQSSSIPSAIPRDRTDAYSTYSTRTTATEKEPLSAGSRDRDRDRGGSEQATTPSSAGLPPPSTRENPQVEIFKSFRVSIEDPCHKVLPVALKKYNILADWRQYALYIVHGDQERCLGLNEKPLILFKQLDREGRKPMFMLRKHASPMEGISSTVGEGGAQAALAQREAMQAGGSGGRSMQLPGGVL